MGSQHLDNKLFHYISLKKVACSQANRCSINSTLTHPSSKLIFYGHKTSPINAVYHFLIELSDLLYHLSAENLIVFKGSVNLEMLQYI